MSVCGVFVCVTLVHGTPALSSLLFIDQPAGTGFSYGDPDTDYDHNEEGVSRDMYNFLQVIPNVYMYIHIHT